MNYKKKINWRRWERPWGFWFFCNLHYNFTFPRCANSLWRNSSTTWESKWRRIYFDGGNGPDTWWIYFTLTWDCFAEYPSCFHLRCCGRSYLFRPTRPTKSLKRPLVRLLVFSGNSLKANNPIRIRVNDTSLFSSVFQFHLFSVPPQFEKARLNLVLLKRKTVKAGVTEKRQKHVHLISILVFHEFTVHCKNIRI